VVGFVRVGSGKRKPRCLWNEELEKKASRAFFSFSLTAVGRKLAVGLVSSPGKRRSQLYSPAGITKVSSARPTVTSWQREHQTSNSGPLTELMFVILAEEYSCSLRGTLVRNHIPPL